VNLASIHRERKDYAGAEPLFREGLAVFKKSVGETNQFVAATLHNLGATLEKTGDANGAESAYREAVTIKKALGPDKMDVARSLNSLADLLYREGKFSEAEAIARESLGIREKSRPDDWVTSSTRSLLGGALLGQKKYSDAEPLLISGYDGLSARIQQIPPAGKSRLNEAVQRLAQYYEETGHADKAAEWKHKLNRD